jgi:hypothetical protein
MKLKTEYTFGILSGLLVCALVMVAHFMGYYTTNINSGKFLGFCFFIIPIVFILIGIYVKKTKDLDGYLDLKDGLKTGIIISFINGIITTIFLLIYFNYINPDFYNIYIRYETKVLADLGKTPKEIDDLLEQFRASQKIGAQILSGILTTPLFGMIPSLIITLILRKNRV